MAPLRSLGNINSAFDDFYARTGKDVGNVAPPGFSATGGTKTTSGNYTIHTFTSSGSFVVNAGSGEVEYVVVAGGGGGGGYYTLGVGNAGGSSGGNTGYWPTPKTAVTPQPVPGDYNAYGNLGGGGGYYGGGGGGGAGGMGCSYWTIYYSCCKQMQLS